MSIHLLLTKSGILPAGGAIAAGASLGSVYYIYTKSTAASSTSSIAGNTALKKEETPISTNAFLARVNTVGSGSIEQNTQLKCTIQGSTEVECKVSKFSTPKVDNKITQFEKTTLQAIATPTSDLAAGNYVVVELKSTQVTFESIKNKSITLKSGSSDLTTLNFDQLLVASTTSDNKEVYSPITPKIETYIVSSSSSLTSVDATTPTITGFRCKFKDSTKSNTIDNFDDSCKLIAIPTPTDGKNITSLEQVKTAATDATTLEASTFYKLTINKNQVYNLDFSTAASNLTVEVTDSTNKKSSPLTLHQQWTGSKFIGKTDLLLAKFLTTSPTTYTSANSKCSFNESSTADTSEQFDCSLHVATPKTDQDIESITITQNAITPSTTLTTNDILAIKLGTPKNITDLPVDKYLYIHTTTGSTTSTHKFQIKTLLSGSFATPKKPFLIT